jgi:hypothetical protein
MALSANAAGELRSVRFSAMMMRLPIDKWWGVATELRLKKERWWGMATELRLKREGVAVKTANAKSDFES